MDKGQIVEQGTHETLLRKNGIYKNMYVQQSNEMVMETSNERTIRLKKWGNEHR
jgi:ATP-binding cassette subfamily B protein